MNVLHLAIFWQKDKNLGDSEHEGHGGEVG